MKLRERIVGWPVWQRWIVLVLAPVLFCCGGTVVGGAVVWFVRGTVAAGRGGASPDAAVTTYLEALGNDKEAGLRPVLDDDQGDVLIQQWRAYRAEMHRGDSAPSKLEFTFGAVVQTDELHAQVDAEVYPVWWDRNGGGLSYTGSRQSWKFSTRESNGWRIVRVEPHPWCGGYVRVDAC